MSIKGGGPLLTIAIPTFDRNEILSRTVAQLLPQLRADCVVVVIDNGSQTAVDQTLDPLLAQYPDANVRIIRNPVNIGANANILRCFEVCETPWLWILGDDDEVCDNAVSVVVQKLTEHPNCLFINFSAGLSSRAEDFETRGLAEFAVGIDDYPTVLFISTGVYDCWSLRGNLRYGYQLAYSCSPHLAVLMQSIGKEGACLFAKERTVAKVALAEESRRWSPIAYYMGCMSILDLPAIDDSTRSIVANRVRNLVPGIHYVSRYLVECAKNPTRQKLARYQYEQICARTYFGPSLVERGYMLFYSLCLRAPSIGDRIIRAIRWMLGKRSRLTLHDTLDLRI